MPRQKQNMQNLRFSWYREYYVFIRRDAALFCAWRAKFENNQLPASAGWKTTQKIEAASVFKKTVKLKLSLYRPG